MDELVAMRNNEITGEGGGLPPSLLEKKVVGKRLLLAAVVVGQCVLGVQPARAVGVFVQLFPLTGEIRLRNKDVDAFPFIQYSIRSNSGSLNATPSVWKSITGNYDVNGNGFIDPTSEWIKIASSATELSEGAVFGGIGSLLGMRAISLGNIWNPNAVPVQDLIVEMQKPDGQPYMDVDVTIEYALDGDYIPNRVVDQIDYNIWRQYYGSTSILLADGNLNGVIDTADYVVWRDNFGKSITSFAFGSGTDGGTSLVVGAAVPEPASAMLLLLTFVPLLAWIFARRQRRVECRVVVRR